jgi:Fe-S-cluster-containing dehydrogenase component
VVGITIDANVCKKDGLCAMTCTYGIFQQEVKGTIPKIDNVMLEKCYRCGQYVPSYDQVLELIRSRRSKRLFNDTPVKRDVLEKVLEAARFAPSQHNEQSTEFVVIQDRKILHEITALTAEGI